MSLCGPDLCRDCAGYHTETLLQTNKTNSKQEWQQIHLTVELWLVLNPEEKSEVKPNLGPYFTHGEVAL